MSDSATPTKWIVTGLVLGGAAVILLVVLLASLRGGGGTEQVDVTTTTRSVAPTTRPATRSSTTAPSDVDESKVTLQVGGTARAATVVAPIDVAPGERLPTVVVLHGLGVNAMAMSRVADWRGAVAEDNFIAVFPQGVSDSWNLGPCCPPANLLGVPDMAFMDSLVAELGRRDDVDPARMYLTGFSNGALLVYRYACEHPGTFAAVAPMAGTNVTGCRPDRPVSLLHQHGDADLVVPYRGGVALGSLLSSAPFPPVEDSVAAWAAADGCATDPTVVTEGQVVRTRWKGCGDDTRVELVRVPGKGHEWPTVDGYDPLTELLGFFGIT